MTKRIILLITLVLNLAIATPSYAKNLLRWKVGVDEQTYYTSTITAGPHGIMIEGKQSNIDKKRGVRYEIVKRGIMTDETYDKVDVHKAGKFTVKLKAPAGSKYAIKVYGFGNMAAGEFTVKPY